MKGKMTKLVSHQLKYMRKISFLIIIFIMILVIAFTISEKYLRHATENVMGDRFETTDSIGPYEYEVPSSTKILDIVGKLKITNKNDGNVSYTVISPKGEKYKFNVSNNEKKISKKIWFPDPGKWIVELQNNKCAGEIDIGFITR